MTTPPPPPRSALPSLPPLEELVAGMRVVSIPMRVRFRGVTVREAALLHGPSGWGEFSPFLEYAADESSRWLSAAVEAGWSQWPAAQRDTIPVNATVPAVPAADVAGVLARFEGTTTAKVKVAERGQTIADDVCRVAAVRDAMGPGGRIRVDANGGWSVAEATDALRRLAAYGLEYAEQPCAEVSELRELRLALARNGIDVLVAADESIRKAEDPIRVAREEAADLVVVKVAPLGGVHRALEVVAACGLPAVVSSALDTSVGMAAGVALAAALPELPFACGLGTVALLEGDVCAPPLLPRSGALPVGRVDADEALLTRWAAEPDRERWWRERVGAAHAHLAAPRRADQPASA
jgi:O-succinylbenzoate synthase